MGTISSYSQIFNVGHKALDNFWKGNVFVQEKLDGSQFSFANINGEFVARSKGAIIYTPDKLFKTAYDYALGLFNDGVLPNGLIFRSEAICSQRHNSLTYSRAASGGIVLYDVDCGDQSYAHQGTVQAWAMKFGVDYAPVFDIITEPPRSWEIYLHRESILGGTEVEGVVLKNYSLFGLDGKTMMAKIVRPEFREINTQNWKEIKSSPVEAIIETYKTEARWRKAIQHQRELGNLVNAPNDIGQLIIEIERDTLSECEEEIKEALFSAYWPTIKRGITKGFPEFYKQKLINESES